MSVLVGLGLGILCGLGEGGGVCPLWLLSRTGCDAPVAAAVAFPAAAAAVAAVAPAVAVVATAVVVAAAALRNDTDKSGTIQTRVAWPLRKDDTRKSSSEKTHVPLTSPFHFFFDFASAEIRNAVHFLRVGVSETPRVLDDPAIRNANRGDSCESIHRVTPIFIKPAIRNS